MAEKRLGKEIENELEKYNRALKFIQPDYEKLKLKLEKLTKEINDCTRYIAALETELKNIEGN